MRLLSALHTEFIAAARAKHRVFAFFARQTQRRAAARAFAINVLLILAAFFLYGAFLPPRLGVRFAEAKCVAHLAIKRVHRACLPLAGRNVFRKHAKQRHADEEELQKTDDPNAGEKFESAPKADRRHR